MNVDEIYFLDLEYLLVIVFVDFISAVRCISWNLFDVVFTKLYHFFARKYRKIYKSLDKSA